jgi:hypothetical protein
MIAINQKLIMSRRDNQFKGIYPFVL